MVDSTMYVREREQGIGRRRGGGIGRRRGGGREDVKFLRTEGSETLVVFLIDLELHSSPWETGKNHTFSQ